MTSRVLIHLFLTVVLFHMTAALDFVCEEYTSSSGAYKPRNSCNSGQFCCGTCNNRYCCQNIFDSLNQNPCNVITVTNGVIALVVLVIAVFIIVALSCCCCSCCCLYNMCRKPRPVVETSTTTVVNTQCDMQQPLVQGGQYPPYQPVPTQQPYGGQPYPAQPYAQGPYQAQPYAPGPPPPYQTVAGPGYPNSQAAYPPTQEGFAPMPQPTDTSKQSPYNPAFMQPPPS